MLIRKLLCEGAEGCFLPTSAFVRQKDRVWFAYGRPDGLNESFEGMRLVESFDDLDLEERRGQDGSSVKMPKDGVWVVEGPAQASDKRNANNRYYPRVIWEKWIADTKSPAQQAIRERAMVGHLEHPKDGKTDGNKLGLVVTSAELREDGTVHARFELLDTEEGRRLQEYTRKKVKWGVSSRGSGSVDESGRVSPDDYVFETWDAVMRPSVQGAFPRLQQSEGSETAPVRGSVKETTSPANAGLDDAKVALVASVESICGSALELLDETGRQDLRKSLISATRELRQLPESKRVQNALTSAFWKLVAIEEAHGSESLDDLIETAVGAATRDQDDARIDDDLVETVQAMRRSSEEATAEIEELRTKLEVAESGLARARKRVNELTGQLAEATKMLSGYSRRIDTAEALLAEGTAQGPSLSVLEAVADVVVRVPQLASHREILESAPTAESVYSFADALLPLAVRNVIAAVPREEPVVEVARPTLPLGVVRSELDATKIIESVQSSRPRGANLAAAALASKR